MRIEELSPAIGSTKKKKRVGRGPGSGHGKTACRGHKGQKSRSGGNKKAGFEGGQMPLQRRLPKRGFKNINQIEYAIVNVRDIEQCGLDVISPETMLESGVLSSIGDGLKILGMGAITRKVTVRAHAFSDTAMEKIKNAGGSAEVLER